MFLSLPIIALTYSLAKLGYRPFFLALRLTDLETNIHLANYTNNVQRDDAHFRTRLKIHKSEKLFYGASFNSTLRRAGKFKFKAPLHKRSEQTKHVIPFIVVRNLKERKYNCILNALKAK